MGVKSQEKQPWINLFLVPKPIYRISKTQKQNKTVKQFGRLSERKREAKEMGREVSESCIDSLLTEMVSSYCNRFYSNTPELAARRIEAIGYQVGHQLSERYTRPHTPDQTHFSFDFMFLNSFLFEFWFG